VDSLTNGIKLSAWDESLKSALKTHALAPNPEISARTSSASSAECAWWMTTFAPARAHPSAKIFPTRRAAPVIKMVFPLKDSFIWWEFYHPPLGGAMHVLFDQPYRILDFGFW
jgi:hypothetical protein